MVVSVVMVQVWCVGWDVVGVVRWVVKGHFGRVQHSLETKNWMRCRKPFFVSLFAVVANIAYYCFVLMV